MTLKNNKPRKFNRCVEAVKRKAKKAKLALALAGALLVCGPMKAQAEERPVERPPISMKMGTAYDHKQKDFRALAIIGSEIPLPPRMKLAGSVGFAGSLTTPGEFNVEEAKLNLNIPIAGPVWVDLYGHNSRHFAVQEFAVGGDVGVGLPFGAAIVGFEHIFDGGQRPLYGVLVLDAIKNRLSLSVSGGWVTNMDAGTLGAGVKVMLGESLPAINLHSMAIFNREMLLFSDTRAMLEFEF